MPTRPVLTIGPSDMHLQVAQPASRGNLPGRLRLMMCTANNCQPFVRPGCGCAKAEMQLSKMAMWTSKDDVKVMASDDDDEKQVTGRRCRLKVYACDGAYVSDR